jgi:hypothetical protein
MGTRLELHRYGILCSLADSQLLPPRGGKSDETVGDKDAKDYPKPKSMRLRSVREGVYRLQWQYFGCRRRR